MKIKHVTYYVCQFCGKQFTNENHCKVHEASELGLSNKEYEKLEELEKKEKETSWRLASSSNQKLREAQDKAIKKVVAFREKHNLKADDSLEHIH